MIISPQYGPQLDRRDGTIGELQLELRYVVTTAGGLCWPKRCGTKTFTARRAAEAWLARGQLANPPSDSHSEPRRSICDAIQELTVEPWWCYPGHHDPAGLTEEGYRKTLDTLGVGKI